ncbi:hypothetical protein L228DRAFT_242951 [Xylona heveae TC161]|uniref:Magnesium transporter n=1 Tax=Xylona heveae (strain CBS 132557 / TC161) TaxID=1328760 RepID=A0A165JP52_XYLHT|nr:hypothetical protein L228DRAFT_242951 [Xylona heveae TC161]KZF26472.1 hypothetical protein L228DRAFT_242951 [Xylona heveae TC161]
MTILSKSLTLVGSILLFHACYSAHEHTALYHTPSSSALSGASRFTSSFRLPLGSQSSSSSQSAAASTSTSSSSSTDLPLDIILETLLSVLVICLGLVLGANELRPIAWRVWAGQLERTKGASAASGADKSEIAAGNPFRALEERVGFWDVRAQRKDFANWVRGGDPDVKVD